MVNLNFDLTKKRYYNDCLNEAREQEGLDLGGSHG